MAATWNKLEEGVGAPSGEEGHWKISTRAALRRRPRLCALWRIPYPGEVDLRRLSLQRAYRRE